MQDAIMLNEVCATFVEAPQHL